MQAQNQSSPSTRSSLPAIATASPRLEPSPRSSLRSITPAAPSDPPIRSLPGGSSTLQRAMQGMGGDNQSSRGRTTGRSSLVPRTNGEFAANQLSGNPSPTQRNISQINRGPTMQSVTNTQHSNGVPAPETTQSSSTSTNAYAPGQYPNSIARSRPQSSVRASEVRGQRQHSENRLAVSQSDSLNRSRRTQSQSRPQANGTSPNRAQGARRQLITTSNNNGGPVTRRTPISQNRTLNQNAATVGNAVANRNSRPGANSRGVTTRRSSTSGPAAPTSNTPARNDGGDGGTLPTTPGQLIRARRRSEIAQDLLRRPDNGQS